MQTALSADQENAAEAICGIDWSGLGKTELSCVAVAYYYFSVQFRENLLIARELHPQDTLLEQLVREECATDNLSPWPGVADVAEAMNHDEFMRRLIVLSPIQTDLRDHVQQAGEAYLSRVRALDPAIRAASIADYEDGGLERLFRSILRCPDWDTALLQAFRHFLMQHITFDSDPNHGHGSLARHLGSGPGANVLWDEFRQLLGSIPGIAAQARYV